MSTASGRPSGPPPGSPAPQQPITPPVDLAGKSTKSRTLLLVASVAIVALLAGAFVITTRDGETEAALTLLGDEVFLEPAQSIGTDPFFADTEALVAVEPVRIPIEPASVPLEISATNTGQSMVQAADVTASQSIIGATPGLYGGTKDNTRCNRQQLVAFLEANTEKGTAWAEVQGIQFDQIREFVDGLTPVVLLKDTRVTNHGFRNGVANPIQSTLQAGTAVLVDATGIPRVRCACGNPLSKPIPQSTVRYLGPVWDDFDPGAAQQIDASPPIDTYILQNLDGGIPFRRPTGTTGEADRTTNAQEIDSIPNDIYIQSLLGDRETTTVIGGEITNGVIIKSDGAIELGLDPSESQQRTAVEQSDDADPSQGPAEGTHFVGTLEDPGGFELTFETSSVDLYAAEFLTGEITVRESGYIGDEFLCTDVQFHLTGENLPLNANGQYTGIPAVTSNNCGEPRVDTGHDDFSIVVSIDGDFMTGTITDNTYTFDVPFTAVRQ